MTDKTRIEELQSQLAEFTAYFDDLRTELNEQIKIRVAVIKELDEYKERNHTDDT